jgi:hypothetical protein
MAKPVPEKLASYVKGNIDMFKHTIRDALILKD